MTTIVLVLASIAGLVVAVRRWHGPTMCVELRTTLLYSKPWAPQNPPARHPIRLNRFWACRCGNTWQDISMETKAEYEERMAELTIAESEKPHA